MRKRHVSGLLLAALLSVPASAIAEQVLTGAALSAAWLSDAGLKPCATGPTTGGGTSLPSGGTGLPPSREASADHRSLGEGGQPCNSVTPTAILFQRDPSNDRDSLWNGVLIGAGIGAAVGMLIAPQSLCGSHDTECSTIVRVAIGLPAIAGGIGIGALVDGLMSRRDTPRSGLQVNWRF